MSLAFSIKMLVSIIVRIAVLLPLIASADDYSCYDHLGQSCTPGERPDLVFNNRLCCTDVGYIYCDSVNNTYQYQDCPMQHECRSDFSYNPPHHLCQSD